MNREFFFIQVVYYIAYVCCFWMQGNLCIWYVVFILTAAQGYVRLLIIFYDNQHGKCMAFQKKQRELPSMMPWVDRFLHLGNRVSNHIDGGGKLIWNRRQQVMVTRTAHPICRMQQNKIYYCHFTGWQIWDLFSQGYIYIYGILYCIGLLLLDAR